MSGSWEGKVGSKACRARGRRTNTIHVAGSWVKGERGREFKGTGAVLMGQLTEQWCGVTEIGNERSNRLTTVGSININGGSSSSNYFVRETKQKHLTFLKTYSVQIWEADELSFGFQGHIHPHGDDRLCKSGVRPRVRALTLRCQHLTRQQGELKLEGQAGLQGGRGSPKLSPARGLRHCVWPVECVLKYF